MRPTGAVLAALLFAVPAAGQSARESVGPLDSGGVIVGGAFTGGLADPLTVGVTGQIALTGPIHAFVRWINWTPLDACPTDAVTECQARPHTLELGIYYRFAESTWIAPFVGIGGGAYLRSGSDGPVLSLMTGLDIALAPPLALRMALRHHEVLSARVESRYGDGVRFTAFELGVGLMY